MKTFTEDEINSIFGIIEENLWQLDRSDNILTKEIIVESENYRDQENILLLENYKVYVEQDGDHRHDGQFVDYTFTFISPEGKETELYIEMCLMVGWNYGEDVTIE